jgi:hypothetical protein
VYSPLAGDNFPYFRKAVNVRFPEMEDRAWRIRMENQNGKKEQQTGFIEGRSVHEREPEYSGRRVR